MLETKLTCRVWRVLVLQRKVEHFVEKRQGLNGIFLHRHAFRRHIRKLKHVWVASSIPPVLGTKGEGVWLQVVVGGAHVGLLLTATLGTVVARLIIAEGLQVVAPERDWGPRVRLFAAEYGMLKREHIPKGWGIFALSVLDALSLFFLTSK